MSPSGDRKTSAITQFVQQSLVDISTDHLDAYALPSSSHHINTVNALIGRFRAFMQPFCGPASRNLAAYGRWHAARDNADRSYSDALRLLLASGPCANTVC